MSPHRFQFILEESLASYFRWGLLASLLGLSVSVHANPVITEFMASNEETLVDDDGEPSDWIEIFNPTSQSLSLSGWFLTDSEDNKTRWQFPAVNLGAGDYLIVFASGENRASPGSALHTDFKLSAGGEYLALVQPDGLTVESEFSPEYPAQSTDVSYGVTQPLVGTEDPVNGFFVIATPGAPNGGAGGLLLLDPVTFSRTSGPFLSNATLSLSGAGEGEIIHYKRVDPSETGADFENPTLDDLAYSTPIQLTDSVVIRAAIFSDDGARRGPITTHHFLRVDNSTLERVDTFSSQLPIVVFDNHGVGVMDRINPPIPAWMYIFEPNESGISSFSEAPTLTGGIGTASAWANIFGLSQTRI